MKTKPAAGAGTGTAAGAGSGSGSGSGRVQAKRSSGSRERERDQLRGERDKLKLVVSGESGASSQCDTPPLTDKDTCSAQQGKLAGVGPESIQCTAEHEDFDLTAEAAAGLAEDVSFKLRQLVNNISLYSQHTKKTRVEVSDVNSVLKLMDTDPVLGPGHPQWVPINDDYSCESDAWVNVYEAATIPQTYVPATLPSLSVEWITDEKSLANNVTISTALQTYYTKISRAILNGSKKVKDVAIEDLSSNSRIGPILPNLFNLAVLVLNDDNLNALNVPVKKPLQSSVLDMVEALCNNPCSLDTNIQQQLQRLFPVMVSNILGNGPLADKMTVILTKITQTWPSFVYIGKGILFEYLSQGIKERLTSAMIRCLMALGRQALVECLADHLDHVDSSMHAEPQDPLHAGLREAVLDASSLLMRPDPTTYLEDFVTTDYTLYEMLGDSIAPQRLLTITKKADPEGFTKDPEDTTQDEDLLIYTSFRSVAHRAKIRTVPTRPHNNFYRIDNVFELTACCVTPYITVSIKGSRPRPLVPRRIALANIQHNSNNYNCYHNSYTKNAVVAGGRLARFRYKLPKTNVFPIFGMYTL